jgi:hypothetical protein
MLIGDVLYPVPATRRTTASIVGWWESKRPTYNLIVGATGLVTLSILEILSWLPPHIQMPVDWRPIAAYAVLANVCYSFGWMLEAGAQRLWGDRVRPLGPALFRQGVAFSVGLTMLPIVIGGISWVVRAGIALFR